MSAPPPPPVQGNMLAPIKSLYSTPIAAIPKIIVRQFGNRYQELAKIDSSSTVLDIGCGNACVLIEIASSCHCNCIGIEINEERAQEARNKVAAKELSEKINIITADALTLDWALIKPTVVFLYLLPMALEFIAPRLKLLPENVTIISYVYPIPGWEPIYISDFAKEEPISIYSPIQKVAREKE